MNPLEQDTSDYVKYRGKCKEFCEEAIRNDPTLRLVRGYYYCVPWGTDEAHWWTVRQDGTIYDPTKDQFPDKGAGFYEEFDGFVTCSECGKRIKEEDAEIDGNGHYAFCSGLCHGRFVGVY
jgi:hypothetical protein